MMNQKEFIEEFKKITEEMVSLVEKKNTDYSYGQDAYRNFMLCEQLGICLTEKGILVRMSDKMTRIANLLEKDAEVKSESIQDTLRDLSNYSLILAIYLKQKKNNTDIICKDIVEKEQFNGCKKCGKYHTFEYIGGILSDTSTHCDTKYKLENGEYVQIL